MNFPPDGKKSLPSTGQPQELVFTHLIVLSGVYTPRQSPEMSTLSFFSPINLIILDRPSSCPFVFVTPLLPSLSTCSSIVMCIVFALTLLSVGAPYTVDHTVLGTRL